MLNLVLTTDLISVITSSGADIDSHVDFVEAEHLAITSSSTMTPGKQNAAITGAGTTTICAAPGGTTPRNVKAIHLRNIDGAVSNDLTVQFNANGTLYTLFKCTLLAGEELVYHEGVWFHYDSNGAVYGLGIPYAAQADMEAATSAILVVTPAVQHYHPGMAKFWVTVTGGGTPANAASYNVTGVADTNTGRMTVTIATDFSSANWSLGGSGMGSTTVTSAAIQWGVSKAAGTIEIDNSDLSATPVVEDPTVGYDVQGFGDQ